MDYRKDGQITVEELIVELLNLPKKARNSLVWHEGCDCMGAASTVTWNEEGNTVTIGRCN